MLSLLFGVLFPEFFGGADAYIDCADANQPHHLYEKHGMSCAEFKDRISEVIEPLYNISIGMYETEIIRDFGHIALRGEDTGKGLYVNVDLGNPDKSLPFRIDSRSDRTFVSLSDFERIGGNLMDHGSIQSHAINCDISKFGEYVEGEDLNLRVLFDYNGNKFDVLINGDVTTFNVCIVETFCIGDICLHDVGVYVGSGDFEPVLGKDFIFMMKSDAAIVENKNI